MKCLLRLAGAIALVLPSAARAQTDIPPVDARGVFIPPTGLAYRNDATGKTVLVSTTNPLPVSGGTGGGGGGSGDASASNQATQIAAANLTNTRLGDITTPATGSTNQRLSLINATLGSPLQAGGTIGNTAFGISGTLPAFAATPTFNLGAGGLGTSGSPIYTAATVPSTGAVGSAAPANANQVGGVGPAGSLRSIATDTGGRLAPAQGVVASARTSLAASTATSISAAAAARVGLSIQVEAALTANLFLCTTQTTACSATNYDALVPSGAGAGTVYTFLFAPNSALYAFSTATAVLVANSWVVP